MVIIKTSMGDIKVELFEEEAPETVKNFLQYVDDGHYDNTIFHRVIDNFMIQGGGFDTDFNQKDTREPITNEADNRLSNDAGTLAMARTMDVHSATNQFFINVNDNDFLNYRDSSARGFGYCVFGKVVDGMDVVNKIKVVETGSHGPHDDVPIEQVVIQQIVRDA
jgi:peptidyl-prolyl cis-trans isomerase B (cyclophilin B)